MLQNNKITKQRMLQNNKITKQQILENIDLLHTCIYLNVNYNNVSLKSVKHFANFAKELVQRKAKCRQHRLDAPIKEEKS